MNRMVSVERGDFSCGLSEPWPSGLDRSHTSDTREPVEPGVRATCMSVDNEHLRGNAIRLSGAWEELLRGLICLGVVTVETQNPGAILQTAGGFRRVQVMGNRGMVHDDGLELRLLTTTDISPAGARWRS